MGVWDSSSHILGEQEAESRQEEGPGYQTSRSTFSDPLPLAMFHPFKVPQPSQRGSPAGIKCSAQESVGETLHTQITAQTKQASSLLSEECVHTVIAASIGINPSFLLGILKGVSNSLHTSEVSLLAPDV